MLAGRQFAVYLPGADRSGRKGKRYLVRAGLGSVTSTVKQGISDCRIAVAGTEEPADGRYAIVVYPVAGTAGDMDIADSGLYHIYDPDHLFIRS